MMETSNMDKEKVFLHVHYRAIRLEMDSIQIAALERFFSMARMIANHLLMLTKYYADDLARAKTFTLKELERETLKFMNESNYPPFEEGLLTPGILKGILVSWLSEWNDFRQKRINRPQFQKHQDPQRFYIIDSTAVEYTENKFKMLHCPELELYLKSSRFPISNKAHVHLFKRMDDGSYWLYTLHESVRYNQNTNQDEVLSAWCDRILTIDRELKSNRRRYLATSGARRGQQNSDLEIQSMTLRKITLDRLLRAREVRVQSHIAQNEIESEHLVSLPSD